MSLSNGDVNKSVLEGNDKLKILIVNSKDGKLSSLVKKCNKTNKYNGPFDYSFILGIKQDTDEKIEDPAKEPTYFCTKVICDTVSKNLEEANLKPLGYVNTFEIGKSGKEVKIGMIPDLQGTQSDIVENAFKDVDHLDILMTYHLPSVIINCLSSSQNTRLVDDIIKRSHPKYVFCSSASIHDSGKFIELNPFQWKDSQKVTRILSLAEFKNKENQTWFYAFNLSSEPIQCAAGLVDNPYERKTEKREAPADNETIDHIVEPKKRKVIDIKDCFFCLGSEKSDAYMVISVGQYSYMSISKGPLSVPKKVFDVNGHVLLIPIAHIKYVNSKLRYSLSLDLENKGDKISESDAAQIKLIEELNKYQDSLTGLYKSFNFGTCIFEINSKHSIHYHQQCLPVKLYFSINRFMQTIKRMEGRYSNNNYNNGNNSEISFRLYKEEDYNKLKKNITEEYISIELRVVNSDITDDENRVVKKFYILSGIDSDKYVDLQFPRKALSIYLNLRERMFWNNCVAEKKLEEQEAEKFRNYYESFDFTLKQ